MSAARKWRQEQKSTLLQTTTFDRDAIPRLLNVVDLVDARMKEINDFTASYHKNTSMRRVYQTVSRHLRRRAMSHNVHRLPKVLREAARREMKKMESSAGGPPTRSIRPSRRARRSPRTIFIDYALRALKQQRLETHFYLAKRTHMGNLWGYRLPLETMDKSERAISTMSLRRTIISDVSMWTPVELQGPLDLIQELLASCHPYYALLKSMSPGDGAYGRLHRQVYAYNVHTLQGTHKEVNYRLCYPSLEGLHALKETLRDRVLSMAHPHHHDHDRHAYGHGDTSSSISTNTDNTVRTVECCNEWITHFNTVVDALPWKAVAGSLLSCGRFQWVPVSSIGDHVEGHHVGDRGIAYGTVNTTNTVNSANSTTSHDNNTAKCWMWVHPSSVDLVLELFQTFILLVSTPRESDTSPLAHYYLGCGKVHTPHKNNDNSETKTMQHHTPSPPQALSPSLLTVSLLHASFCRFQLRGPTATHVLSRVLRVHPRYHSDNKANTDTTNTNTTANPMPSMMNDTELLHHMTHLPPASLPHNHIFAFKTTNPRALVTTTPKPSDPILIARSSVTAEEALGVKLTNHVDRVLNVKPQPQGATNAASTKAVALSSSSSTTRSSNGSSTSSSLLSAFSPAGTAIRGTPSSTTLKPQGVEPNQRIITAARMIKEALSQTSSSRFHPSSSSSFSSISSAASSSSPSPSSSPSNHSISPVKTAQFIRTLQVLQQQHQQRQQCQSSSTHDTHTPPHGSVGASSRAGDGDGDGAGAGAGDSPTHTHHGRDLSPLYTESGRALLTRVSPLAITTSNLLKKRFDKDVLDYASKHIGVSGEDRHQQQHHHSQQQHQSSSSLPLHYLDYPMPISQSDNLGYWHQPIEATPCDDDGGNNNNNNNATSMRDNDIDTPSPSATPLPSSRSHPHYAIITERTRASARVGTPKAANVKGNIITYIHAIPRCPDHLTSSLSSPYSTPHPTSGFGWDIIIPKGWGQAFFSSLVLAGATITGYHQMTRYMIENGYYHDAFPLLHPDSPSGMQYHRYLKHRQLIAYHRTTKARIDVWRNNIFYPLHGDIGQMIHSYHQHQHQHHHQHHHQQPALPQVKMCDPTTDGTIMDDSTPTQTSTTINTTTNTPIPTKSITDILLEVGITQHVGLALSVQIKRFLQIIAHREKKRIKRARLVRRTRRERKHKRALLRLHKDTSHQVSSDHSVADHQIASDKNDNQMTDGDGNEHGIARDRATNHDQTTATPPPLNTKRPHRAPLSVSQKPSTTTTTTTTANDIVQLPPASPSPQTATIISNPVFPLSLDLVDMIADQLENHCPQYHLYLSRLPHYVLHLPRTTTATSTNTTTTTTTSGSRTGAPSTITTDPPSSPSHVPPQLNKHPTPTIRVGTSSKPTKWHHLNEYVVSTATSRNLRSLLYFYFHPRHTHPHALRQQQNQQQNQKQAQNKTQNKTQKQTTQPTPPSPVSRRINVLVFLLTARDSPLLIPSLYSLIRRNNSTYSTRQFKYPCNLFSMKPLASFSSAYKSIHQQTSYLPSSSSSSSPSSSLLLKLHTTSNDTTVNTNTNTDTMGDNDHHDDNDNDNHVNSHTTTISRDDHQHQAPTSQNKPITLARIPLPYDELDSRHSLPPFSMPTYRIIHNFTAFHPLLLQCLMIPTTGSPRRSLAILSSLSSNAAFSSFSKEIALYKHFPELFTAHLFMSCYSTTIQYQMLQRITHLLDNTHQHQHQHHHQRHSIQLDNNTIIPRSTLLTLQKYIITYLQYAIPTMQPSTLTSISTTTTTTHHDLRSSLAIPIQMRALTSGAINTRDTLMIPSVQDIFTLLTGDPSSKRFNTASRIQELPPCGPNMSMAQWIESTTTRMGNNNHNHNNDNDNNSADNNNNNSGSHGNECDHSDHVSHHQDGPYQRLQQQLGAICGYVVEGGYSINEGESKAHYALLLLSSYTTLLRRYIIASSKHYNKPKQGDGDGEEGHHDSKTKQTPIAAKATTTTSSPSSLSTTEKTKQNIPKVTLDSVLSIDEYISLHCFIDQYHTVMSSSSSSSPTPPTAFPLHALPPLPLYIIDPRFKKTTPTIAQVISL